MSNSLVINSWFIPSYFSKSEIGILLECELLILFCTVVIDITDWLWLWCWYCYCGWCHFIKPSSLIDIIFTQQILFLLEIPKIFFKIYLSSMDFNLKSSNFYVFHRVCYMRFLILSYLCHRLKAFFAYCKIQKRAEVRSFPYRYLYRIGILATSLYSIEVLFCASCLH